MVTIKGWRDTNNGIIFYTSDGQTFKDSNYEDAKEDAKAHCDEMNMKG